VVVLDDEDDGLLDMDKTPPATGGSHRLLVCAWCGTDFWTNAPRSIYCRPQCQQAAYRQRHREELREYFRARYVEMRAAVKRLEELERGGD
jgi:hypothetical protein